MSKLALFASLTSVCLLTNCTPYQEIDRGEKPGDVSVPVVEEPVAPVSGMAIQDGAADGGAGQIDSAVSAVYKIRTKADVATSAEAMMALADKDNNGQLTLEEFGVVSPALAQADNSVTASAEGGAVANPGAGEMAEKSDAPALRVNEFFAETAGSDGVISQDDLAAALMSRFEASDADGNGELSANEAQTFAASMLFARE